MGLYAVTNPASTSLADGVSNPTPALDRQGAQLASELHGKWYSANYRGKLFHYNRTAVTIPVVATNVASVFTLYNPPNSGVNAELVSFDLGQVLATTVVDAFGLYYHTAVLTAAGTFTTPGTALSGVIGNTAGAACIPYSAWTSPGTSPTRFMVLGSHGATTNANSSQIHVDFDGKAIVPPGVAVHVLASTAAGTSSGLDPGISWCEWPV